MQVISTFAISGNLFWVKVSNNRFQWRALARHRPRELARRLALIVVVLCCGVAAFAYDIPTIASLREWSDSGGAWFPFIFVALYVGLTQFPIPRTVFTLSAGILFGPWLGAILAIFATTVSAALSLLVVRYLARDIFRSFLRNRHLVKLDYRLEQRGWLAVLSLRMIAGVPFSVLNYACAVSSIRFWPYVLATAAGSAPITIAVVLLGDALIDGFDTRLVIIAAVLMVLGIIGLIIDARAPVVPKVKPQR